MSSENEETSDEEKSEDESTDSEETSNEVDVDSERLKPYKFYRLKDIFSFNLKNFDFLQNLQTLGSLKCEDGRFNLYRFMDEASRQNEKKPLFLRSVKHFSITWTS